MTFLKMLGYAVVVALAGLALFLANTPWRVHGGRFITEYLILAGAVGIIALIVLVVNLRLG